MRTHSPKEITGLLVAWGQQVVAVSAADGSEMPLGSGSWKGIGRLAWFPDGSSLVMVAVDERRAAQLRQPLSGGAPRQMTDFKSEGIYAFDWSRDGKQLALWRGMISRNAVLISDFR